MQNWGLEKLTGLDFNIEYNKGKDNFMADVLSTQPYEGSLTAIFHVAYKLLMEAEGSWKHDPKLQKIMDKFQLHQEHTIITLFKIFFLRERERWLLDLIQQ